MKAWTDLSKVPMPANIAKLPRDARGYPIPSIVLITPDGVPHFQVNDSKEILRTMKNRLYGICGEPLNGEASFTGGPRSAQNRLYLDPPMHHECCEYAQKVCPYLGAPKFGHAVVAPIPGIQTQETQLASNRRPAFFVQVKAAEYRLVLLQGEVLFNVTKVEDIAFWFNGQLIEPAMAERLQFEHDEKLKEERS